MALLPLLTDDAAPEASRAEFAASEQAFGFVPGLHRALAGSPETFKAYKALHQAFLATSFSATEKTVVWQTINVEHGCHYCVPAHSGIARMLKVDPAVDDALRAGRALADPKLEALRVFTLAVVRQRGDLRDAQVQAFLDAGYGPQQVLEVILGVSQKVMSNYVNHLAATPVDAAFAAHAWQKADAAA